LYLFFGGKLLQAPEKNEFYLNLFGISVYYFFLPRAQFFTAVSTEIRF